jgi:hypothetical protein
LNDAEPSSVGSDWDRYWRGTWEAAAHEDGSPQEAALEDFWRQFFRDVAVADNSAGPQTLLDVASGNGAVIRYAQQQAQPLDYFALDYSHNALLNLQSRYPEVSCLAGDARQPAIAAGSIDLVVSQFGVEYAGATAVEAIAELVAGGGYLALVLHLHEGAIYQECAGNHRAILAVQSVDILELARAAFLAGYGINAGTSSVDAFKQAERAFTPAVRGLEQLLQRFGSQAAGGLLQQLYRDIAEMYPRMSSYAETEVITWLDGMVVELEAYAGRMLSMVNVAVDQQTFDQHCQRLRAMGFSDFRCAKLAVGKTSELAAWTLVAQRKPG